MSKLFKRVTLGVLCAILVACAVAVGTIFGLNSKANKITGIADTNDGSISGASLAVPATLNTNFDYELVLSGTPAEMAAGWNEAMSYAGKRVLVTLATDWTAQPHATYQTSFNITAPDGANIGGSLYVPAGVSITLNLNGHKIDRAMTASVNGNGNVIQVFGTLNLIDSSGNDSGMITGGWDASAGAGVFVDGTFNMYGGSISGNKLDCIAGNYGSLGAGVCVGQGTFNMYGGKITENGYVNYVSGNSFGGGGVAVGYPQSDEYGTFNMYGGEISNNKALWGGGVALFGKSATVRSTFNMYGGKIINNTISEGVDYGGGVYAYNYSDIVMYGGEISGNKTLMSVGGGVVAGSNSTFEMNGGKITDNQALATNYSTTASTNKVGAGGGGVYIEVSSSFVMNGGEISYNYALEGGGVKVVYKSSFEMNGGIITRNLSMQDGWAGAVSIGYTNTSTTKCTVALNGGAIVDNNKPYKDYSCREDAEGFAMDHYSTCTIGGPIIIANNIPASSVGNINTGEFWIYGTAQVTVNGPLYQNGQAAQIPIFCSSATTTGNVVSGVTAANLCGYTYDTFFSNQHAGKSLNYVSSQYIRYANDTTKIAESIWSYKTDGDWVQLGHSEVYAQLTYGEKVTAVKYEVNVSDGSSYKYAWPSGTAGYNSFKTVASYIDNVESTSVTDISDVGIYSFVVDLDDYYGCVDWIYYNTFRVEIVPKDITVVINNDSAMYGDGVSYNSNYNATPEADGTVKGGWQLADGSTLVNGDSYSSLGITLGYFTAGHSNTLSYNLGSFAITGLSSSSNYNVSFVNGTYTITTRPITVILHDDSAEYTETVTLKQRPVAVEQDDDGNYIGGGWHYADDSLQIVAGDIVNGVYPLVLTSSAVVTSGYTAVGEYSIYANFTNSNYTVTLLNSDGSAPADGDKASATFTVTGATITVTSASQYEDDNYASRTYNGNAQSVAIPQGAINLKGGVTSATVKYVVYESDSEDIPEETPKADAADAFWVSAPTTYTLTNAGDYVVYSLITATNHKALVYKWTFSIGKSKAAYTLSAKHGTTALEKDDSGVYKITYDGVAVTVSISFTTTGATTTTCPVKIYYKGTNSGNTYGTAADTDFPDESGTTDSGTARNLGNTNAPKDAGTYQATVIADPDATSDFTLDTDSTNTFSFTIEAKKVDKPTATFANGSGTYNGNTQTVNYVYDTAAVKITACSGLTDEDGEDYNDLTQGASNANTATKQTTTAFTGKDAGDYAVKFDLTSTRNYKWNDEDNPTGAQIVSCTVAKAKIDFDLVSPLKSENGTDLWQWEAGTTADNGISAKENSLKISGNTAAGLYGDDAVTFDVYWYKYDSNASGNPALNSVQNGISYNDLDVAISTFTDQASYFLLIQVATDDSNANSNYTLTQTDTHFTPNLEGVKYREITVGAGSVDVSRIIWKYQLEGSGEDPAKYVTNAENADDNTKLVYTTKTVSGALTAVNYIMSADLSDLSYLEIDTSKGENGYAGDIKKSGAGKYTITIYVKIVSGSSYEFDTGDKSTYDADTTTTASVKFSWEINKKVISFVDDDGNSLVKWAYYVSTNNERPGEDAVWTEFSETNQPSYTGKYIYVKVSDSYLESLGINLDDIEIEYNNERAATLPTTAKPTNTTTASIGEFLGETANNYSLASTDLPQFEWVIGKTKITVTGWSKNGQTLTDDEGHEFTLPAVKIDGDEDGSLADKITYKYTYTTPDGVTKTEVDEDTMKADLFAIADENGQPIDVSVSAYVSEDNEDNYDITFDGANQSYSSSIGDDKLKIYITLDSETAVYGGVTFSLSAAYYLDNDLTQPAQKYDNFQVLTVTITAPDGEENTIYFTELANIGLYIKNAGTYQLMYRLVDEDESEYYKLAKSFATFTVQPKALAVPQITGEIVFNGETLQVSKYLDDNYKLYLDMVNDDGDPLIQWITNPSMRDVGEGYTAILALTSSNYVWEYPEDNQDPTKATVRYTVVDETLSVGGDTVNATYTWSIQPYVLDAADLWNLKGKDGASINLPSWVTDMINEEKIDLSVEYGYRTDKAGVPETTVDFKGGSTYWVEAYLGGADKDNFVFANNKQTSELVEYTVPQSGAAAFFGSALNFVKKNWLWFVIGAAILLFLILLIIIIAVAKKKKKKKEAEAEAKKEKEEAKAAAATAAAPMLAASAAMADEKAKLEAEKAKMEAELAKAKAQAELDLQKAKMEAEMAKMRAEAEAQNKQAQQAQQPVQQPAPAQQPVQQPAQQIQSNVDANLLAELKAELAALRASHAAPTPAPSYAPAPYGADAGALAKIEAEIAAMRSEQHVLREAELKASQELAVEKMKTEFARLRADSHYGYSQPVISPETQHAIASGDLPAIPANIVGALILSAMNMAKQPAQTSEQPPQVIEAESQSGAVNTPTMYPPDAVITTTTTVDTTNRVKPISGGDRRDDSLFDIDGFYDKFEGNK